MKLKSKISLLIVTSILAVFIVSGVSIFFAQPTRDIASGPDATMKQEFVEIKTRMVQSIRWTDEGDHMKLELSGDENFCELWESVTVTLYAEGVAVSGQPPEAKKTGRCQKAKFEMVWPKKDSAWSAVEKSGDFSVEPSEFYVSYIEIEGLSGEMKISNHEIDLILNQQLQLRMEP